MADDPKAAGSEGASDDAKAPVRDAEVQPAASKAVEAARSVESRDKASPLDKALPLPAKAAAASKPAKAAPPKASLDPHRLPEPPPWWKTLRADPPAHIRTLLGFGLIALILVLWWVVTRGAPTDRIISPSKLPSPGEVFGSFGKLMDRDLVEGILSTLERVFKGVGLAAIIGILVGVAAASNRGIGSALAPLVIFLRSVPMGALIPLTLLLFSDGEKQKWMFIFLAIVPFVFSDTVKAISIVPERYVETAQTLGASRFQIIRKVLVPLALPDIITSLRFQLGLALGYIMLVEVINTPHGIGTLLMGSERQGLYEHIYLLLFVIALIAFTLDIVLRTLQRGVFAWRKDL
jgi:ABC-type nitrate/sulfonate/bicarbonate transport system permease component